MSGPQLFRLFSAIKKFVFVILVGLFLASCKTTDDPSLIAGSVINKFANSCSSAGPWSQAARGDAQALVQIFEELKSKDQCKDLAATLQAMSQTAANIHGVYADTEYLAYRQIEEELQELTMSMSLTSDPALRQSLAEAIVERQKDLAVARASRTVRKDALSDLGLTDQFSLMTNNVSSNFQTLFNHSDQLSSCIEQSPSALLGVFSNLAAIGGSFASPVLGAQMSTVSNMLNLFLKTMRDAPINRAIWDLNRSQMPQALTCGLESITNFYCQAEDANEIVNAQAQSYTNPHERPTNFWKGIDLLSRRLPVLNDWLLNVRAGLAPQNEGDSDRVNAIREKRLQLDTANNSIIGALNYTKRLIERAKNEPQVQRDELIKVVAGIAAGLAGNTVVSSNGSVSNSGGIFGEQGKNKYEYACLLAHGEPISDCGTLPSADSGVTVQKFILDNIYTPHPFTIEQVINNFWPAILQNVRNKVLNEFNEIIFIDPTSIIAAAHESNVNNMAPRRVLAAIGRFVTELRKRAVDRKKIFRLELIDDTLSIIRTAGLIMDRDPKFEGVNPLVKLYDIFKLDFGVQFFSDRLSRLVQYDLNDRMEDGELPGEIADIVRGSGEEILRRLTASGTTRLGPIMDDLSKAKNQSQANYEIFRTFMFNEIGKIIESQYALSLRERESLEDGHLRSYGQGIAHLCLLVYSTGHGENVWPSRESERICKEAVLFSHYPDANLERIIRIADLPAYLAKWQGQPRIQNRMRRCAYYNFQRSERLLEVLRASADRRKETYENEEFEDADFDFGGDDTRHFNLRFLNPGFDARVVPQKRMSSQAEAELWKKLLFPF